MKVWKKLSQKEIKARVQKALAANINIKVDKSKLVEAIV